MAEKKYTKKSSTREQDDIVREKNKMEPSPFSWSMS